MTSTQRAQALKLLGARSMMRLKDFAAHRIGPETLARLVRGGTSCAPREGSTNSPMGRPMPAAHWPRQGTAAAKYQFPPRCRPQS